MSTNPIKKALIIEGRIQSVLTQNDKKLLLSALTEKDYAENNVDYVHAATIRYPDDYMRIVRNFCGNATSNSVLSIFLIGPADFSGPLTLGLQSVSLQEISSAINRKVNLFLLFEDKSQSHEAASNRDEMNQIEGRRINFFLKEWAECFDTQWKNLYVFLSCLPFTYLSTQNSFIVKVLCAELSTSSEPLNTLSQRIATRHHEQNERLDELTFHRHLISKNDNETFYF